MEPSTPCGPAEVTAGPFRSCMELSTVNIALERIETLTEEFIESEIDNEDPEPHHTRGIILGLRLAAEIVRDQTTKH